MGQRRRQKIDEIIREWQRTPMYRKPRMKRNDPVGLVLVDLPTDLQKAPEILKGKVAG